MTRTARLIRALPTLLTASLLAGGVVGALALPATAAGPPAAYPPGSVVSVYAKVGGEQTQLSRRLVGGLTREAATRLVAEDLAAALGRSATVTVKPAGATRVTTFRVSAHSLLSPPRLSLPVPSAGAAPLRQIVRVGENATGVRALLDKAAAAALRTPVDARASLGRGSNPLAFDRGRAGSSLDRDRAAAALVTALRTGKPQPLAVVAVPQRWTASTLNKVIVVRTRANTLDVFTKGKRTQTIRVATGQAGYPSPHGSFHVVQKQPAPSWYNPHSAWSVGYPDVIGPGPDNPLGTRALALDAPGILIHGIPRSEDATLGSNASHGCIRVQRATIEALYPTIPAGTPVIITN